MLRSRNGVTLTRTGEELLRASIDILTQFDLLGARIAGLESDERGTFILGCHESLGAYFLPLFMRKFMAEAPNIELVLWNGTSSAVMQAVVDRTVHFGLAVNPAPHPDLVMVKLFRDAVDLFVLAEPGEQAESRAGAEARLRKGPLILAGRVTQSQELLDKLATSQLLPPRILSCGDLELVKSLVLAGLGVAVLPRRVAAYWQEGKLRRLHASLPFIKDQIYLVFRADAHRMRAWTRTKDALTQSGKELDASFEV